MLFSNTPLSYLFVTLYLTLSLGLFFFSNSLLFLWVIIELQIIIFLVISIPHFRLFHSSLLLYFLIQSVSSLMVLSFAFFSNNLLFLSFIIKLGIFPFYGWYLNSLPAFPPFPLLLALTTQNLGSILLLGLFLGDVAYPLMWLLVIFSFLGALSSLPTVFSIRLLLVWSSLITNMWFILALNHSLGCFLAYFSVYTVLITPLVFFGSSPMNVSLGGFIGLIFSLGGFPPLPLFFVKIFILYHTFIITSTFLVIVVLLSSVISIYMYCGVSLSYFLLNYSKV